MKTARNVVIILAIAALVVLIPGGGKAASAAGTALRLAFYASLAWVASVMYRQHKTEIFSLGDRRRAVLYVAIAVGALTIIATSRMWQTSGGSVAWLVLVGVSVYTVFAVVWSARRY
jgi:hypothetical protein